MTHYNDYGTCPVCNGTTKVELTEQDKQYSWNAGKTHKPCRNCGAQYQYGTARGKVPLDKEGNPCKHSYDSAPGDYRCTHRYTCKNCGDSYVIDSSD